ncbi:Major facilitator transporter-like protein [Pseudohyphozyma bogoriensis]|nr:Major facilitator transporter-like protein [Pseudohyphozyma bogoriensis]
MAATNQQDITFANVRVEPAPEAIECEEIKTLAPVDQPGFVRKSSSTDAAKLEEGTLPRSAEMVREGQYLEGKRLFLVFMALLLTALLTALDTTILATALPTIASDYNAFGLQGWMSTSYLLPQISFLLIYGQLLRIWPAMVANMQVMAQSTRLEIRPKLMGVFGAVWGLASVVGPLVGGVLTQHATWRWCFYINLPIGGAAMVAIVIFLHAVPPMGRDVASSTKLREMRRLDWIGGFLSLAAVSCLTLALQWGGNSMPWSTTPVIVTLVVFVVLTGAFGGWLWYRGAEALVRLSLLSTKSVNAIVVYTFFKSAGLITLTYYVPIFYQLTRQQGPTQSGLSILPFMLSTIAAVILTGQIVSRVGRYWHTLIVGAVLCVIGSGLLFTVTSQTETAKLIGYQILAGVGLGIALQNPSIAMQTEFNSQPELMSQANGLNQFFNSLGGTVGLSIAQAVFAGKLNQELSDLSPAVPIASIRDSPLDVASLVPAEQLAAVVEVFVLLVPYMGVALFSTLFIHNLSIANKKAPVQREEDKPVESGVQV